MDFLRRITQKAVKQWNRSDLNKKFVELARDLLVSKEKNLQDKKKILELEDEIRKLKNEKARPKFKKKIKQRSTSDLNHSDDKKKDSSKPKKQIDIDETIEVDVDKSELPADARFIASVERIIQNISIQRKNIKFIFSRYYSPSLKKTYTASHDQVDGSKFGSELKALIDYLYYKLRVPHEKIRSFLEEFDIHISKGQLNNLINRQRAELEEELIGARDASVQKSSSHHLDETGHKFNDKALYTFCFANSHMSYFESFVGKTKADAMSATFGRKLFCMNSSSLTYMARTVKDGKLMRQAKRLLGDQVYTNKSFNQLLDELDLNKAQRTKLREAGLYGAYIRGALGPPLKYLVTDDAKNLNFWRSHQLCWVHEIRKYKLLDVYGFTQVLDDVLKQMRDYYHELRRYRLDPKPEYKKLLSEKFDLIFTQKTEFTSINSQFERTVKNKKKLLYVLEHPEVEIHNNLVETDIREKVIKRKISLFNRSFAGVRAWDLMLSLSATCRKNGISFYQFLVDRYSDAGKIKYLPQIILSH